MEDWVVENLCNGNRESQIEAATQLSKLSSKQRHRLAETGIIPPLISMLQSQDFEAIEASLLSLLGLAFGSERSVCLSLRLHFSFEFYKEEKSSDLTEKAISLLKSIVFSSEDAVSETTTIAGAIRIIVEAMEDGSPQCKEHAVGILLHICQSCRDKYRGLILMEGVMPGLLQLSVDGTWGAKNMARDLLFLLRDCTDYASTSKQSRHELMEQIMQAIDADGEKVDGTTLRLVQEMINKLNI
ncbi:uncharacterized protein LOC120144312 [Hibiscus syriacus]|nr:uncharacterized protein LOC120144312 [Hibiscus syriacus]